MELDREEFKLRLDIKTGDAEVDQYIWELHNYLVGFSASSITQLIIALDHISMKLVDDLALVAEGGPGITTVDDEEEFGIVMNNYAILSNSKDDKIFERIMTLVTKIKDFEAVSNMATALRPAIAEKIEKLKPGEDLVIEGTNIFESIAEQITSKRKK